MCARLVVPSEKVLAKKRAEGLTEALKELGFCSQSRPDQRLLTARHILNKFQKFAVLNECSTHP